MQPPPLRDTTGRAQPPTGAGPRSPCTIRPACPADAPLLPTLERDAARAFCAVPELAWLANAGVLPLAEHHASIAAQTCWVAMDATGQLLGFLSARACTDALHIQEMSVALAAQGHGLGRRLLHAACTAAQTRGLHSVTLTTFVAVPWNAPFYASAGFCILPPHALNARLASILEHEHASGFAPTTRCAMRFVPERAAQCVLK